MSSSDPAGIAAQTSWLAAEFASDVEAGLNLPYEVRGLNNVVVARGLTGTALTVPPGTYFVTARDAEGIDFATEEPVSVPPGGGTAVRLQASSPTPQHSRDAPEFEAGARSGSVDAASRSGAASRDQDAGAAATAPGVDWIRATLRTAEDPLVALLGGRVSTEPMGVGFPPPGTWRSEGVRRCRALFSSPGAAEVEPDGGDVPLRRYRAVIPVDRTGPTWLTMERPRSFHLGEGAEIASDAAGNRRFVLDLGLEFQDRRLDRFWRFITSASFREAWAKSEAMAPELLQTGVDWMRDKLQSPVGATLGAYVLLRANRLERLETWSANLARWFPDNADALVIRAEVLARLGEHREAALLLSTMGAVGCPWIRSGLQYAWRLASEYSEAHGQEELRSLDSEVVRRLELLQRALGRLNGNADQRRLNTVIHWRFPEGNSVR